MTEPHPPDLAAQYAEVSAENVALVEALHTIVGETSDAEVVRIAAAALTNTKTGQRYLSANPLRY